VELEDSRTVISFVAKQGNQEIGNIDFLYFDPALETRTPPLPSLVLRERVHGTPARDVDFLQIGWRIYWDLRRDLDRYGSVEDFGRILDWGCGCGRVSRHFMNAVPGSCFFGCDIDSEAIDWMERAYPSSRFDAIRPLPPTPYQNEFFDLVYGISIFTHLDEATQFRWLDELRRIITKDGVVAVSIHDESMCPTELLPLVKAKGFFDEQSGQSADFAPFSDKDYYRTTYHSKAYVMDRWSNGFEILEYVEGGIASHQSLVLMRRRDEASSVDVSREVEWQGKTSALESLRIFYYLTWYRVRRLLGKVRRKLGRARAHP
jgi:SAM-dependent methyltransferase